MEIMTLRVNGIISPPSAAGHVVLSSNLTAWDIRGTQPCSQMPGPCPPHARKEGHPRRFTVTHGATATALDLCSHRSSARGHLLCKQGVTAS